MIDIAAAIVEAANQDRVAAPEVIVTKDGEVTDDDRDRWAKFGNTTGEMLRHLVSGDDGRQYRLVTMTFEEVCGA